MTNWIHEPYHADATFYSKERTPDYEQLNLLEREVAALAQAKNDLERDLAALARSRGWNTTTELDTSNLRENSKYMLHLIAGLHNNEAALQEFKRCISDRNTSDELIRERWKILHRQKFVFENGAAVHQKFEHVLCTLDDLLWEGVLDLIDPTDKWLDYDNVIQTRYVELLKNPYDSLDQLWALFVVEPISSSVAFRTLVQKLFQNSNPAGPYPSRSNLSLTDAVKSYFGGTPFEYALLRKVPVKWSMTRRFSHTHILGGTGAGKSTLIKNMIWSDLTSHADKGIKPSVVVIDPTSDLVQALTRGDDGFEDRIILIDPRDVDNPVAINPFAINQSRLARFDKAAREQASNGLIQTFTYFFSALMGAPLTGKQGILFEYAARLLITLPQAGVMENGQLVKRNATIRDMQRLMMDPTPYLPTIAASPKTQRDFFEKFLDSKHTTWNGTREEIYYRIDGILGNPTIERLLTLENTKIDLFEELNNGAIIVIDTAKDFLFDQSNLFGRFWISLVLQAILERGAPGAACNPTFLYIDEAASFFDDNIDSLLTDVRKYNCGCILSHQTLAKASPQLLASLHENTRSKFVSNTKEDAHAMAFQTNTSPEFILNLPEYYFAAYVSGVTPQAISVSVEQGPISGGFPRPRNHAKRASFLAANRLRVSFGPVGSEQPTPNAPTPPSNSPHPTEDDISKEW